ncbi:MULTISPECIES: hypothetical protein [unclassified Rathayibacter]|uniref:hypothetical protein n=1 Tax=unclassified Rathayibacter TaxID=2609250 RepID=UPI0006F7F166|nr:MULTISPECIES: hypothetical protein [unclassified Rathayibacter]KQQ00665.1 hypothetical protein ASF42_15115 [Rathayibacter sp. Leaf294]KQS10864.1 hypothetical protein ASG06_15115 [Rathayibacter sp. Leaf185]
MPDGDGGARRAFLRRSFGEAAAVALDAVARVGPQPPREKAAAASLAAIDHLVVLSFAGRDRVQVFGGLDGDPGAEFSGGTDEVMTAPALGAEALGERFAPEMLPVHTLLAHSFARADRWSSDGRDPLAILLRAARDTSTPWALVVDGRQGVSTTLLVDPGGWPPGVVADAAGSLLTVADLQRRAATGGLPPVVLIEPRSLIDPADFASARELGEPRSADARRAEQLLHEVYDAARSLERAGRRVLLLVTARGEGAEVPALLVASGAGAGARIDARLDAATPALLLRARWDADRRALADEGVLALVEAASGPQRPLSRWPRTAPAFAPTRPEAAVPPRLTAALRRSGLADSPGETADHALVRLRAGAPWASIHSDEAAIRDARGGRER